MGQLLGSSFCSRLRPAVWPDANGGATKSNTRTARSVARRTDSHFLIGCSPLTADGARRRPSHAQPICKRPMPGLCQVPVRCDGAGRLEVRGAGVGVPSGLMRDRAMVRWFAPGALAVLVMLPRLASPQFGLLDDGLTLQTGRETIGRWSSVLALIPETGRFFPAYWLVYSAVFGIVGVRPLAFFTLNVFLLAGLLALLARLVRLTGGTPLQAAVAVVLFAVCGPAIEAFYTLSKAEPLQMMWIGVSVLAAAAAASEPRSGRRAALITLAGAVLLLAYTTKETSAVLIPVSLG